MEAEKGRCGVDESLTRRTEQEPRARTRKPGEGHRPARCELVTSDLHEDASGLCEAAKSAGSCHSAGGHMGTPPASNGTDGASGGMGAAHHGAHPGAGSSQGTLSPPGNCLARLGGAMVTHTGLQNHAACIAPRGCVTLRELLNLSEPQFPPKMRQRLADRFPEGPNPPLCSQEARVHGRSLSL